jgi:uncharacterized repeat protein (TIGR02543 family)
MLKKVWLFLIAVTLVTFFFAACSSGSSGTDITGWTVTFDKNGGDTDASPTTKTVSSPATTIDTLPTAPSRAGYAFTGWNTETDGSGDWFTASTPVTDDITVYAQWRQQSADGELIVTFNKNGGDTEADPALIEVVPPATTIVTLPTPPTRTGYTFAGWNTEADGSGDEFTATTTVTTDVTVYAQWTGISYQITCDKNGGDTEANPKVITVTFPDNTIGNQEFTRPTREGYIFKEWNTKADGSGVTWTRESVVTEDITVYAIWEEIQEGAFIVTFDKNGGDIDPLPKQKQVVPPETTVDELPEAPTYAKHVFTGWNTKADGTGTEFTATTPVTATITVYAKWVSGFTVTFNPNGGTGEITTKTVISPSTTVDELPEEPTRSSYVFGGWYDTYELTGGIEFTSTTPVTDDITVYARWKAIHTVTFSKNNTDTSGATDVNPSSITVIEGDPFTLPTPPTRSEGWGVGMVFDGWNTEANGTGINFTTSTHVNTNLDLYAKWRFVAGTPQVVGNTLVHNAPQMGNNSASADGQNNWNGTMNNDGSATYSSGAIRYQFPSGYANYDFFELEYVHTGNLTVILKQYNNSTDYAPIQINGSNSTNQYPSLANNGSFKFNIVDAKNGGIALQRNNNNGTVKFTKVTFTKAPRHTITFNANHANAESIPSIEVADGTPMSNLPTPASRADKYTFVGWYDAATGGTLYTKTSIMPAKDLGLFARWKAPVPPLPPINVDFSGMSIGNGFESIGGTATVVSNITSAGFTYETKSGYGGAIAFKVSLGNGVNLSDYDKITFTVNPGNSECNNKTLNLSGGKTVPAYKDPSQAGNAASFITNHGTAQNLTNMTVGTAKDLVFTIDKSNADALGLEGDIYIAIFMHANPYTITISNFKILQTNKVDFSAVTFAGVGGAAIPNASANPPTATASSYTYALTGYNQAIAFEIDLGTGKKLSDYSTISFSVNAKTNNGDHNFKQCNVAGGTSAPAYSNPNANASNSPFVTTYNGSGNTLDNNWPKSLVFTIDGTKADTMNLTGTFWLAVFINAGNNTSYTISDFELY